jgi:hypothetical protein
LIAEWRMRNLRLAGPGLPAPEAVVGWLTAVQSQDYGPAKWSVAQRTDGANDALLEQAFARGTILRTHVLRPTWHFVLPADIRWMLKVTAPRVHAQNAHYYRQLELDADVLARTDALLASALAGGRSRTRKALEAELNGAGVPAADIRMGYILIHAELNGVICSGPLEGKQHTYALLDERAPGAKELNQDEALAELTRRYFTGHGPATVKDFRWWSSLTLREIQRGLDMIGSELQHATIDGLDYWFAEPRPHTAPESPTIHLLQGYDEYLVGYTESRHVSDVTGTAREIILSRPMFIGAVVLDTQVVGHWKRTVKRDVVSVQAALYFTFDSAQTEALQSAADAYAAFLGFESARIETRPLVVRQNVP